MRIIRKERYLIIPIEQGLGNCDFYLKRAMERVANKYNKKSKGKANIKAFFRNRVHCSGNSIKHMTKVIINPRAKNLDNRLRARDLYQCIRKIDIDHYAEVIAMVIEEYVQIIRPDEMDDLIEYIKKWRLLPESYQRALCNKVFDGYKKVKFDEQTANHVNKNKNTKSCFETIIKALSDNEVAINYEKY